MLKAYKYRIYPNNEQKIQIAKTFGCCRFVYNCTLAYRKEKYDALVMVDESHSAGVVGATGHGVSELYNTLRKRKKQLVKPTVTITAIDN